MRLPLHTFSHTVRVYIEDTDFGGVVYYANYLKFFERARTEWLRAIQISQQELLTQHQVVFVVASAAVNYLSSARLDDVLTITLSVERLGRASVDFTQQAWRGETKLAEAHIRVACVDGAALRPRPFPQEVLEKIKGKV